jgi:hypothetical protein
MQGKEVSIEVDGKLTEMEAEMEKVEKQSKPEDDGLGVEKISDELVLEISDKTVGFSKELGTMRSQITAASGTASPTLKITMTKLSDRIKGLQGKITEVSVRTKDQREKVLSAQYVKEATNKAAEAEASTEKMEEAEAPYLKGIEVALEESTIALKACDEVAAIVQAAVSAAKSLMSLKTQEMKKFNATNTKEALESFKGLEERVSSVSSKLAQFKKDTESRKKAAVLQEAGQKVKEVEAEIEKLSAFITPLADKDPEAMSSEEAASIVKGLEAHEQSAATKLNETRNFVGLRARDAKEEKDKETVKELNTKLTEAQTALTKAKKDGSTHTEKIKSKALIQEAADKLKEAEAEVAQATTACAPLLEEKGEKYLVKASLATLATALRKNMAEKDMSVDKMWKEVGTTEKKFAAFVGTVPEAFERPECAFSEERRIAMFKSACDGKMSNDDFKEMLSRKFVCVQGVALTDALDVEAGKSICMLQKGDVLVSSEDPKKSKEEGGMMRLSCKKVGGEEEGWVTMTGTSNTKYLEAISAFAEFAKSLDASLATHSKNCSKLQNFFTSKVRELGAVGKDSPLAAAKEELSKTVSKIQAHSGELEALKKKVAAAKQAYSAQELKEKNAHIEAKEQKQVDEILAVAKPAVTAMEEQFKKFEEVCKPLVEKQGKGDDLLAFATPLSVLELAKAMEGDVKSAVDAAKEVTKKQQAEELVAKAVKGPLAEGKKELQKWMSDAAKISNSAAKALAIMRSCCNAVAEAKVEETAAALRADMQSKGQSLEDYFAKVADADGRITEDAFCKLICKLSGGLPEEHAKLVSRHIDSEGVGRHAFMRLVQIFMKVVKEIAITPNFDVTDTKEKMVRKANLDEIVEVLEGPKEDDVSKLERVKVKALQDGSEGWMSVKGNQGKIFLEKTDKPLYCCTKDLALGKDFKTGSEEPIRTLKAEEVVEILEGPCKETLGAAMRARVKASSDGKIGFATVTDQHGVEFIEKCGKVYTCTATCAITDIFDITSCKVIKKMASGDVFTISEGPRSEDSSGVSRVLGKSQKDDTEGWITVTGNAGTVFAKVNEKLLTVKKEVALQQKFATDSPNIRMLAEDESLEVLDAPKEEKFLPVERMKVRAANDGVVGWVTTQGGAAKGMMALRKWSPIYKVLKPTPLCSTKGLVESSVRDVAAGEVLVHIEGPVDFDGTMWVRCRAKKDSAVGWAQFKDDKGAKCIGQ